MKIAEPYSLRRHAVAKIQRCNAPGARPGFLHLVTDHEMANLHNALDRGEAPADFATKLDRLADADLASQFIAQNSRLFISLLLASKDGSFRAARPRGSGAVASGVGLCPQGRRFHTGLQRRRAGR